MTRFKSFEMPTVVKSSVGAVQHVGEEGKKLGVSKAMIVTDDRLYQAGVVEPIERRLRNAGIKVFVFREVRGEPDTFLVARGSAAFNEHNCDGLVAVGGGSCMDTAKAIGVEVVHRARVTL